MSEESRTGEKALFFTLGAFIGATIALLLALRSGEETRKIIASKAREVAVAMQAVVLWGIHRSIRAIAERIESLSASVEQRIGPLSERTQELLVSVRSAAEHFQALQKDFAATSQIIHRRVVDLDKFLAEVTDSGRLQVARVQDLVETASATMEDTVSMVQRGLIAPLAEFSALLRGIRTGFNFFFRGRASQQAHQDEEMFI